MTNIPITTVNYHLNDAGGHIEGDQPLDVAVRCEKDQLAILLDIAGHGLCSMQTGEGNIVALEYYEGRARLLVWADINREDPTHVIDLSDALEEKSIG